MKPATEPHAARAHFPRTRSQSTHAARALAISMLLLFLGFVGASCGDTSPRSADLDRVATFDVRLLDEGAGTPDDPLPFATTPRSFSFELRALSRDGTWLSSYESLADVAFVPGETRETESVEFVNGVARVDASVQFAYGTTRLWVTDRTLEDGGSGVRARGASPPIYFAEPTIENVRFNPDSPTGLSPLMGREARISEGILLVTNIVANGFYAADVTAAVDALGRIPGEDEIVPVGQEPYTSLFVFTFNFPEGVVIGDRLCQLAGGVAEFQGQTQLTFPNYVVQGVGAPIEEAPEDFLEPVSPGGDIICRDRSEVDASNLEIQPVELAPSLLDDDRAIRQYDSALVRVRGGLLASSFDDCDFDRSGSISGPDETACRSRCQRDVDCTELTSYRSFDQLSAVVDNVVFELGDLNRAADFDALEGCEPRAESPARAAGFSCRGTPRRLESVTGTLRLVDLGAVLLKIITPRDPDDLVFAQ